MPHDVPRLITRPVQLRPQDCTAVPNSDLHRIPDGPLRLPGDVDGGPRKDEGGGGIDSSCGEEGACVGYARSAYGVSVGEEDYVADGSKEGGAADEESALADAFGDDGYGKGGDESEGVRRDGEKLGDCCRVSQVPDDGWLFGKC